MADNADGNANSQLQEATPDLESGIQSPGVPADPADSGTTANIKKTMYAIMTFGIGGALVFSQVDTRNSSQKIFYYASVTFLGMSVLSAAVTRLIHNPERHGTRYLSFSFMFPTCLMVLGLLFVLVFLLIRG